MTPDAPAHVTELERLILEWSPMPRPVSCSNCLHAVVYGDPERPLIRCEQGFGGPVDIWQVIRRKQPRGFRDASKCEGFVSMDDEL